PTPGSPCCVTWPRGRPTERLIRRKDPLPCRCRNDVIREHGAASAARITSWRCRPAPCARSAGRRSCLTGSVPTAGTTRAARPALALRRKRDSSLRVAAELVRDDKAAAFISAGNTGAAMAISMFVIGVLRGIDRPAIAAVLPSLRGFTVLIDAGANITPKPWHLFQFAIMGHVYARDILGLEGPRVGLLSVGEEEGKGNDLTREAYELLKESRLNFIGNIEGRDVYNGNCDVVVTDGLTGNVALKISESLAEMVGAMIKEELTRDIRSKLGAALSVPAFSRFKKRVDYTEMGGA